MTCKEIRWAASALICLILISLAGIQSARAQIKEFNVPAQSATTGIPAFARQAGIQILVSETLVRGKKTAAVTGVLPIDKALVILLEGTGLSATSKDGATFTLSTASSRTTSRDPPGGSSSDSAGEANQTAQVNSEGASGGLQEIIVTAQKRAERLQDVPVPVSVIDPQSLVASNELRTQDYIAEIPGLTMASSASGIQSLSIRGVSLLIGGQAPTVGILIDDAPFGAVTGKVQDIDPGDLVSIEVLRGPQGTLYGSGNMGGLVKYVTADPSTAGFSGRVQAGTSSVYNGSELGYNFRGSVNVPLTDDLAVRLSGFTRIEPGYIDNVETGQNGINEQRVSGGHFAALWRPTDQWSIKLSGFYQKTSALGSDASDVLPGLGELQQFRALGSGHNEEQAQDYSATVNGKIGTVDVKSISAYSKTNNTWTLDYSTVLGAVSNQLLGVTGDLLPSINNATNFSQEIRFSDSLWSRLDWLAGGFYTHQTITDRDSLIAENPVIGIPVGDLLDEDHPSAYSEYAGFFDLTYHFTNQFDVQIGGRESHETIRVGDSDSGELGNFVYPEADATADSFTYLLTPQFKFSPDLMMYARLASGFRAGGFNVASVTSLALGVAVPGTYAPDKTYNYDVGFKGEFLDHRLSIDASLYYVAWKGIQLNVNQVVANETYGYTTNAGGAKSEGVEFSFSAKPLAGLTISGWVDYDNAVLTSGFPADATSVGAAGDKLPFSIRLSGNLSAQQDFGLWGRTTGFVGSAVSYQGDRLGKFNNTPDRQYYPGYAKTDLRAGVKDGPWIVNIYANNVTDRRGLVTAGFDYYPPASGAIYIQPRLIGLNISRTF